MGDPAQASPALVEVLGLTDHAVIRAAWYGAEKLRPYRPNSSVLAALIPPGGEWSCVALEGSITRSVRWGAVEVALVNPEGSLDDQTEGQIAMALRATPILDTALRVILRLAKDHADAEFIAVIAETAIEFLERPAPACRPREDDAVQEDESYGGL